MPGYGISDELQPPGAGLPSLERHILNFVLKAGGAVMSDNMALRMFPGSFFALLYIKLFKSRVFTKHPIRSHIQINNTEVGFKSYQIRIFRLSD